MLSSLRVRAPSERGWTASREIGDAGRKVTLSHASAADARFEARFEVTEVDSSQAAQPREARRAELATLLAASVGDRGAALVDLPSVEVDRLGPPRYELALRAEQGEAAAGGRPRRMAWLFERHLECPTARAGSCSAQLIVRSDGSAPVDAEAKWRQLLDGIEPLPPEEARAARIANAGALPKQMEAGYAARSLTLPAGGVQWWLDRERWLRPAGFDGAWGLSVGITDRLQLSAPGLLTLSFGDPEGRDAPETSISAGWGGFDHDAVNGSRWAFGAAARARRRLTVDTAWRAGVAAAWVHASRTVANDLSGAVVVGLDHDFARSLLSTGLEVGYSRSPWRERDEERIWVGGLSRPLLTLHLPPADLGLTGAAAWDGKSFGVLAGVSAAITF